MPVAQSGYPEADWIILAITYTTNAIGTSPYQLCDEASRR